MSLLGTENLNHPIGAADHDNSTPAGSILEAEEIAEAAVVLGRLNARQPVTSPDQAVFGEVPECLKMSDNVAQMTPPGEKLIARVRELLRQKFGSAEDFLSADVA